MSNLKRGKDDDASTWEHQIYTHVTAERTRALIKEWNGHLRTAAHASQDPKVRECVAKLETYEDLLVYLGGKTT